MPIHTESNFPLTSGDTLPELNVAYELYGSLNADRSNAILVLHGTTSTHHAAGRLTPDLREGWWEGIIGSDKLFDTDQYCIISSNMLGSSYGTTGPGSIDPETGRAWGADFPPVTVEDMVHVQKVLIDALGIKQLLAVAGGSVGGLLAFQWAVTFPDSMKAIIAADCGPVSRFGTSAALPELVSELQAHPNWNGGRYAEAGGLKDVMTRIRVRTLLSYQFMEKFEGQMPKQEIETLLQETAEQWADEFDPMSLVVLNRALGAFDVSDQLGRIRAHVFYVLCDTDEFYPADIGTDITESMRKAGVNVVFHQVCSHMGHYSTSVEPEKWVPQAREFLASI